MRCIWLLPIHFIAAMFDPMEEKMRGIVVRNIPRSPEAMRIALGTVGVATIHEAMDRQGLAAPVLRPIYQGASIAGNAVTVLLPPGDNWMIHVAVEQCRPGDILVVASESRCTDGALGELLATSLRAAGVTGAVLDVGCRDVRALQDMQFPVWCRAISARGTVKASLGSVNIPIVCAEMTVRPGDIVVADDDGVICIPHAIAEQTLISATRRQSKENESRQQLAAGKLGLDRLNMRPKLSAAGLRYVDDLAEAIGLQDQP
jgi:4-hydroxy-4-methyl-2-oxoglutarate aldolase